MRQLILLICLLYHAWHLNAQTSVPILDRKVTIKITNQPLFKVLNIISETADFNFSYGNNISVNKLATIHAENRTIKELLDQLFNREVSYQQIGNHLVLQKILIPKKTIHTEGKKPSLYKYMITGYIRDLYSGDGIQNASIYEKESLSNTISGDFGYYQLYVSSKLPEITVHYALKDYGDTAIIFNFENNGLITSNINFKTSNLQFLQNDKEESQNNFKTINIDSIDTNSDSTKETPIVWQDGKINMSETNLGKWFVNKYQRITENNIRDSFYRDWQFTVFPPFGTNKNLSGMVTNHFSANLIVGYNGGVQGFEIGFLNILNNDMKGSQFAGIGNLVGGKTYGSQFAYIFNHNMDDFYGFQAAFGYNYNSANSIGVQVAGIMNFNQNFFTGIQIAGTLNYANQIHGGQLGTFVNIAKNVSKFQIGLINIADTNSGVSLGLINFIGNGIHQLEISRNEAFQYGLAYRSGTTNLYSVILANTRLPYIDSNTLMSYGWGLGTSLKLFKPLRFTLEATAQQMTFNFNSEHLNLLSKLSANLELKLFKGFALFGGASLNYLIADPSDTHFESTFANFGTNPVFHYSGTYDHHMWVGYQFGVRLF